jgi:tetratricopeptide (TPR) repeat protein
MKKLILLISLLLGSSHCMKVFSQRKYESKTDSLKELVKTDVADTSKLVHLCELTFEVFKTNPDTAFTFANEALELGSQILKNPSVQNNPSIIRAAKKGMAASYGGIGAYYYRKGEFPLALENQLKALDIRKNISDSVGLASTYNNIGVIFRDQGDHARALQNYTDALNINIGLGDKAKAANNINNIGLVYVDQKDFDIALKYFNQALALNESIGNKAMSATNLNNIGIVYYQKKKYPVAIQYYQKAFNINLEVGNYHEVANNLVNIGVCYDLLKDHDNAIKNYLEALDLNQQLGNQYGIALNMGNVASVYVEEKKYKEAKDYLNKAILISDEIKAWQLIQDHNLTLSKLDSITGDYKSAYLHYQKYSAAKDTLFNDSKSKDIGRLEMKQEIENTERIRKATEEEKARIAQRERDRKNTLQYSGMFITLLCIALIVVMLGFIKVSAPMARSITFFTFLLVFEFMLLLIDPYVDRFSGGEPVYKLILNALLACLIFPLNAALENGLKKRLTKKGGEKTLT